MIFTQSYVDLGLPNSWIPIGAFAAHVDGETNKTGHGVGGYQAVLQKATAMIIDMYGGKENEFKVCLLNAKFEQREGNAHPSYGRYALFITGDLYLTNVKKE